MKGKKPNLKVVKIKSAKNPKLNSLEDRLYDVVNEFIENDENVTTAEIVGTLEMVKLSYTEDDA